MRQTLANDKIDSKAAKYIENYHAEVVKEVISAVEKNEIVVVGMKQNPFVGKARKLLDEKNKHYTYLEYGSYLSQWKQRLAIKLWSGWPTYPQIFIKGKLVGGYNDLLTYFEINQK